MLEELRVRDLGVIEDLSLQFGDGMTALSGETGAGKTLVVEALAVVLGGRASGSLVRSGAEEALVEARFVDADGEEVILSRAIARAGRSRAWIDGAMAPVAALAERGAGLVEILGQHEHHGLFSASARRALLDHWAGIDLGPRDHARSVIGELERAMGRLGGAPEERARRVDILRYEIGAIEGAHITGADEERGLREEETLLATVAERRDALARALELLDADESGVAARVGEARKGLGGMAGLEARLRSVEADLVDLVSEVRGELSRCEDDPTRLAAVSDRLAVLAELRRKFGSNLGEVLEYHDRASEELAELVQAEDRAAELARDLEEARVALGVAEETLGGARRAAAPTLAEAVETRLRELAMGQARFAIEVEGRAGDDVELLLGANPGEPMQPLAKVASGGELARTMLAIRLSAAEGPTTMIFDEVDAGVGGSAAVALAGALDGLAATGKQVLVVTHLAQVAAVAGRQFAVEKEVRQGRTVTVVADLDADGRTREISRMLSGQPDSGTARAHAEELLARSASTGQGAGRD